MVEQLALNQLVAGSNPVGPTSLPSFLNNLNMFSHNSLTMPESKKGNSKKGDVNKGRRDAIIRGGLIILGAAAGHVLFPIEKTLEVEKIVYRDSESEPVHETRMLEDFNTINDYREHEDIFLKTYTIPTDYRDWSIIVEKSRIHNDFPKWHIIEEEDSGGNKALVIDIRYETDCILETPFNVGPYRTLQFMVDVLPNSGKHGFSVYLNNDLLSDFRADEREKLMSFNIEKYREMDVTLSIRCFGQTPGPTQTGLMFDDFKLLMESFYSISV